MTKTALILGASGKIGTHAARALSAHGWTIRRYDRKSGDMTRAAQGCDLIVNGLNPPNYHNWAELIPAITAQVIAAARASGATVLIPGNVYHFGSTPGEWSEQTPPAPCSKKGRIRLEMERAYRDSGVQTIVLRAGDFIDPDHNGDIMSLMLLTRLKRGRITAPGAIGAIHTYAYLPDWAEAAASLADKRTELARFEDIPFPGHAFTLDTLKSEVEAITGRTLRFSRFPWALIALTAPVWELARELKEMRYLWDTPHTLSPRRLNALLPDFRPTPLREALTAALPADIHPDQTVTARRNGHLMA